MEFRKHIDDIRNRLKSNQYPSNLIASVETLKAQIIAGEVVVPNAVLLPRK